MANKIDFPVRNLKFDTGHDVPRYWHGGRKSVTTFFNNLSTFFPVGERFFIQSVKAHRDYVKDPKLAEEVRTFYAQEGVHGREHDRYNEMLREQGYPIAAMEGRLASLLGFVSRFIWLRGQLAVTCALEHFTSILAHWLLSTPSLLEGAHPTMAALWRWHAAEENEHKAVAFDVFRAAGGTYFERVVVMVFATIIFWAKVLEHQVRLMRTDGIASSLREWKAMFVFFYASGSIWSLIPLYLSYYRPSFEPWELDNRELLENWKRELVSSPVYQASTP